MGQMQQHSFKNFSWKCFKHLMFETACRNRVVRWQFESWLDCGVRGAQRTLPYKKEGVRVKAFFDVFLENIFVMRKGVGCLNCL